MRQKHKPPAPCTLPTKRSAASTRPPRPDRSVASGVAAMKSTATALSATSNETKTQTAGAVYTSNEAFRRVDTASTAAEELSRSIAEINRQLARATEVVRSVADEAQSTNNEIEI